jgi:hypothetical protein
MAAYGTPVTVERARLRDGSDAFAYATRMHGVREVARSGKKDQAKAPSNRGPPSPGKERAKDWKNDAAGHSRAQALGVSEGISGADYHFGACTLHVKLIPEDLITESKLVDTFQERLATENSKGRVVQVTLRSKERKLDERGEPCGPPRSWCLVTFDMANAAQQILSRNAAHVDGLGLEMTHVDIVKATHSRGVFKAVYEAAKKKAATATRRSVVLAKKAREEKRRISARAARQELPNNLILAQVGISGEYNFGSCTLKISHVPKKLDDEMLLKVFFAERLNKASSDRVLQVTLRKRDRKATQTDENGQQLKWTESSGDLEKLRAEKANWEKSWGLVTVTSPEAAQTLLRKFTTLSTTSEGIELNQVDISKAASSHGKFGAIYKQGQKKAHTEVGRLRTVFEEKRKKEIEELGDVSQASMGSNGSALGRTQSARLFKSRKAAMSDILGDSSRPALSKAQSTPVMKEGLATEEEADEDGTVRLPQMSPRQGVPQSMADPPAAEAGAAGEGDQDAAEAGERDSSADAGSGAIAPRSVPPPKVLDANATQISFMSTWNSMTMPSVPRPGRDLPDHWPTSNASRERTHELVSMRSTQNSLGIGPEAQRKEDMRQRRISRKREQDIATYEGAFRLIDIDDSGRVDPMEIVMFVEKMGKKVNTSKFWKLFNDLDLDNSADLDISEFIKVMDELTKQAMAHPSAKQGSTQGSTQGDPHRHGAGSSEEDDHLGRRGHAVDKNQSSSSLLVLAQPPGTETLQDIVEQKRQVADIYSAVAHMREQCIGQGLLGRISESPGRVQKQQKSMTARVSGSEPANSPSSEGAKIDRGGEKPRPKPSPPAAAKKSPGASSSPRTKLKVRTRWSKGSIGLKGNSMHTVATDAQNAAKNKGDDSDGKTKWVGVRAGDAPVDNDEDLLEKGVMERFVDLFTSGGVEDNTPGLAGASGS